MTARQFARGERVRVITAGQHQHAEVVSQAKQRVRVRYLDTLTVREVSITRIRATS